jgi:hypothetical protein
MRYRKAARAKKIGASLVVGSKNISKMQVKSSDAEGLATNPKNQIKDANMNGNLTSNEIVKH